MNSVEKRIEADKILLRKDLSDNQRLFIISQLYKDELSNQFPQLNYALLAWKDSHLKEFRTKEVIDCLEVINNE